MMNYDVTALGELLIDFTPNGISGQGNLLVECNPGGAPCNVLAMLAKRGRNTSFLGKVGDDMFGRLLREVIESVGIDSRGLVSSSECNTTLAFVQQLPGGDRDFSFYRKPGADQMLREDELCLEQITGSRIFHFGSLSMTHEPARQATKRALKAAREAGVLISFDPNLRPPLWDSLEAAKEQITYGCAHCDVLKIAEEELVFLTGCTRSEEGVRLLWERFPNLRLIFVTCGKNGSEAYCQGFSVRRPSYLGVKTIDTTGAGDTFCGCCLSYLLDHPIDTLGDQELGELLEFANAAASLVTTKKGAIRSMPSLEEIEQLMK